MWGGSTLATSYASSHVTTSKSAHPTVQVLVFDTNGRVPTSSSHGVQMAKSLPLWKRISNTAQVGSPGEHTASRSHVLRPRFSKREKTTATSTVGPVEQTRARVVMRGEEMSSPAFSKQPVASSSKKGRVDKGGRSRVAPDSGSHRTIDISVSGWQGAWPTRRSQPSPEPRQDQRWRPGRRWRGRGNREVERGSSEGRMSHGGSGRTGNSARVSVSLHERQTSIMRVRSPRHRLPNIRPITSSGRRWNEDEEERGLWAPRENPGMKDVKRREYHLRKGNMMEKNIVNFVWRDTYIIN
ncbi:sodium channel protein type 8 subunit alpha [Striga asiatica]|uniref:Sodium channel protein type 8 subunit alpha n=1 Tax=Striga asiatica TaxID=4170 RepID=A0A5A7QAQ8_STRAF|nr:sodium channel protein type 8 subunit alpha [Striga asiatica]